MIFPVYTGFFVEWKPAGSPAFTCHCQYFVAFDYLFIYSLEDLIAGIAEVYLKWFQLLFNAQ